MATARFDNEWIRCPNCGRKLGRAVGEWNGRNQFPAIEIKCHSCKELVYIMVGGKGANEFSRGDKKTGDIENNGSYF